jgi:hypothetical protein
MPRDYTCKVVVHSSLARHGWRTPADPLFVCQAFGKAAGFIFGDQFDGRNSSLMFVFESPELCLECRIVPANVWEHLSGVAGDWLNRRPIQIQ